MFCMFNVFNVIQGSVFEKKTSMWFRLLVPWKSFITVFALFRGILFHRLFHVRHITNRQRDLLISNFFNSMSSVRFNYSFRMSFRNATFQKVHRSRAHEFQLRHCRRPSATNSSLDDDETGFVLPHMRHGVLKSSSPEVHKNVRISFRVTHELASFSYADKMQSFHENYS